MEKQEIRDRFLAILKNGKGMTCAQFARNNGIDSSDVFVALIGLKRDGTIIAVEGEICSIYFLNN